MEFELSDLTTKDIYKLMTGSIIPRPIAWVSTKSADGSLNLAPYSYFNAVSADPPTIMFSAGQKDTRTEKDTLRNIEDSKVFVINIVHTATVEAMNATAINAPYGVSEFDLAGVTAVPAKSVDAPRVKESLIHFECELADFYKIGRNTVVFGKVKHIHVDDSVYLDNYKINAEKLQPVGRLSGASYAVVENIFALERPVYKE